MKNTKRKTATPSPVIIFTLRVKCPYLTVTGESLGIRVSRHFETGTAMTAFEQELLATGEFARAIPQPRVVGQTVLTWTGFQTKQARPITFSLHRLMRLRRLRDVHGFEIDWGDLLHTHFPNLAGKEPTRPVGQ